MLRYPVLLKRDTNDTLLVTFPDVPEAVTFGEDQGEALRRALDVLESSLSWYMSERKPIPAPSPVRKKGCYVALPALTEAKIRLYETMRAARISKGELARRLNCNLPQIDRLLDLSYGSRLEQMEAAFLALGKRLAVSVEAA